MKIEGGIINLETPMDRAVSFDSAWDAVSSLPLGSLLTVNYQEPDPSVIVVFKQLIYTAKCITSPPSQQNIKLNINTYNFGSLQSIAEIELPYMQAKEVFNIIVPLDITSIAGDGIIGFTTSTGSDGSFNQHISILYQKYSIL